MTSCHIKLYMTKRMLREFYLLSKGDQRALLLLSVLLFISLLIRITVQLMPERDPPGMEAFIKKSQALMTELARADSLSKSSALATKTTSTGIAPNQAVSPYENRPSQLNPIDINRADPTQLLPLPGIGPVLAGRIIKYRDLLGGYTAIDQLFEVYGLEEETIALIRELVFFDTTAIKKIVLDTASFRDLLRHPYLQLEDVKSLMYFRDLNGRFQSIQDIMDNRLLSDSTLQKVRSYLGFSN